MTSTLNSCASDIRGFEFENFNGTPLSELAIAVKNNDSKEIKRIITENKVDINYKEPIFKQTLLTLAIVNRKKEAFIELLKGNSDPNIILGNSQNTSPLTIAILYQNNCNLYYIKELLEHGANPNLKIIPNDGKSFSDYYPLFTSIRKGINEDECTDVIKLLIEYDADVNCCSPRPMIDNMCEGVINECLTCDCMYFLRFFVIEKKIKIPKIVYVKGGINQDTQKEYSLFEILNTEDYKFEDFIQDGEKVDRSDSRKIRNEILEYLKKTGQE